MWSAQNRVPEADLWDTCLPPNMTYILQVLDLVVNGPLKAHMRQLRAKRIVDYFKRYKEQYYARVALPLDRRVKPKWTPQKPTIDGCILDLCALVHGEFTSGRFRAGFARSFQKTGLMYGQTNTFTLYEVGNKNDTLSCPPTGTSDPYT